MLRRSCSLQFLVFCVSAAAGDRGPTSDGGEPEEQDVVWQEELKDGHWQLVGTEWSIILNRLAKMHDVVVREHSGNENPPISILTHTRNFTLTCRPPSPNGDPTSESERELHSDLSRTYIA